MSPWYYDEKDRKRLDRRSIYEGGGLDCGNDWDEDDDDWDDDDWDDEDDIHECARVHAPNPRKEGVWVSSQPDMYPKGFTAEELNDIYWELSRGGGLDKLLEAASFEEFDEYYNPGTEDVDPAFITEAIVIKKFARTEAVMRRGLVKALRRFLDAKDPTTGTPIELLDPIVGKPRKSGMYAYVTVQLPFSDGQVVSILFHAPEGDGKRITPQDTIVAFRWMLNKRDITNIVAPEDGTEVSIATIGRRLSLLVEKNAPRFAATQKEAQAERRELERVTDRVKELQEEIDRISNEIAQAMADLETATAENGNSKALLQRLKTTNAELRAKLDALQKAKADAEREERKAGGQKPTETETGDTEVTAGTGDKPTPTESEENDIHKGVSGNAMQVLQNARAQFQLQGGMSVAIGAIDVNKWAPGNNVIVWGPTGDGEEDKFTILDFSFVNLRDENAANKLQDKLKWQGSYIMIPAKDRDEYLKLCLLNVKKGSEKRFQNRVREVLNARDKKSQLRSLAHSLFTSKVASWSTYHDAIDIWQEAQKVTLDELLQQGMSDEDKAPAPEETTTETNPGKTPAFVADLNDILAGKYDNDFPKLEELLDAAVQEVESGDEEAAKFGQLAVQADDRYTELLEKDAVGNEEAA